MTIKRLLSYIAAVSFMVLFVAAIAQAQEKREPITVKSSESANGVIFVNVQQEKTAIELRCNQDFVGCVALKPGEYTMLRQPPNRGIYMCSNVIVYSKSDRAASDNDEIGRYCINAEK